MEPPARCRMHLLIPARPPRRRGPALPSRRPESSVVRQAGEAAAVDAPSGMHAYRGGCRRRCAPPTLLAADLAPAPPRSCSRSSCTAGQMHRRREEMYFYLSSHLEGQTASPVASSVGEGFCGAQYQLERQKWICLCCWGQS
jgi:hypothetical protein